MRSPESAIHVVHPVCSEDRQPVNPYQTELPLSCRKHSAVTLSARQLVLGPLRPLPLPFSLAPRRPIAYNPERIANDLPWRTNG